MSTEMVKKVIMVGTTTQNNKMVNGQTMMFQMLVDKMKSREISPIIVDFGISVKKNFGATRVSGELNFIKFVDNIRAVISFFWALILNPGTMVYINTSQSKAGFIRDYLFIKIAKIFKRNVIGHQFGANYKSFYESQSASTQKKIKETLDNTDFFIVEGEFTKQQMSFVDQFEEKVKPVSNGLPQEINTEKILPKTIKEPVNLLYLSNMIEGKGFWDVLEAANLLQNHHYVDLNLVFAGQFLADVNDQITQNTEEAKTRFFLKLEEYGLADKTEYFPGLYGDQKSKYFQKSNFFILPSYYINEGQPVSVLEALAYGCVPVVTNYRLIPSMVNEENGFFVEAQSPHQIAEKVLFSLQHPKVYTQKSADAIS